MAKDKSLTLHLGYFYHTDGSGGGPKASAPDPSLAIPFDSDAVDAEAEALKAVNPDQGELIDEWADKLIDRAIKEQEKDTQVLMVPPTLPPVERMGEDEEPEEGLEESGQ